MANLADELASANAESGDEENDVFDGHGPRSVSLRHFNSKQETTRILRNDRESYVDTAAMVELDNSFAGGICIGSHLGNYDQRYAGEYDGSELDFEADFESAKLRPTLLDKIDTIELLARHGAGSCEGIADDVFTRVMSILRDLGSQSVVEGNASRLITAHSALAAYLAHQTRQLHSLTFSISSPYATTLDSDTIDSLVPMLLSLSHVMPRPSLMAFDSLAALRSITSELIQTLSFLTDTLHMSRQTTSAVSRRLKRTKELVLELKRDDEVREQGERWLIRGNWGERLKRRECAGVCGDVLGGFEDLCNDWRQRLLAQARPQA